MISRDLEYGFPQGVFILLIGILLLIGLLFNLHFFRQKILLNLQLMKEAFVARSQGMTWMKGVALLLAWGFACAAFMQPLGNAHYPFSSKEGKKNPAQDLYILIDASASMAVDDTRLHLSRLAYSQEIAKEIVAELKGIPVSVNAFTSELTPMSPLTHDKLFAGMMIAQIGINEGDSSGTDLMGALQQLYQFFSDKGTRLKTVIVFTDGGDNRGEAQLIQALQLQNYPHAQLLIFGMGSLEGKVIPGFQTTSKLEESFLRTLAKAGKGSLFIGNERTTLGNAQRALDRVNEQQKQTVGIESDSSLSEGIIYDHYFQWPLALALFFLLLFLYLPETSTLLFGFLFFWGTLNAYESVQEREAFDAYSSGQYSLAIPFYRQKLEETQDPLRQAVLHYNLGTLYLTDKQFDKAAEEYSLIPSAQALPSTLARKFALNSILLYLEQAEREQEPLFIKRAQHVLQKLKPLLREKDVSVLEHAIASLEIPPPQSESPPLSLLRKILNGLEDQQPVDSDIQAFLPTVIQEQKDNYDKGCEKQLWEAALPPFFEGLAAYQSSQEEEALRQWYRVLSILKHPTEQQPEEVSRQHSLNQVLQYLQEMERDDRIPPQPRPLIKEGLKPW